MRSMLAVKTSSGSALPPGGRAWAGAASRTRDPRRPASSRPAGRGRRRARPTRGRTTRARVRASRVHCTRSSVRPTSRAIARATPSSSLARRCGRRPRARGVRVGDGVRRAGPRPASPGRWACRRTRRRRRRRSPRSPHSRARAAALVTPGALISTRPGHRPGRHAVLTDRGGDGARAARRRRAPPCRTSSLTAGSSQISSSGPDRAALRHAVRVVEAGLGAGCRRGTRRRTARRAPPSRSRATSAGPGAGSRPSTRRTAPLGDVVEHRTVGDDRDAVGADDLPQRLHPAHRAAGDEDDRHPGVLDRGEHPTGGVGERAVGAQQGAVEVGGDEGQRGSRRAGSVRAGTGRAMTSRPSSLLPRRSVKPALGEHPDAGAVGRLDRARTRTPSRSVSASSAASASVARPCPRARLDQAVADLDLAVDRRAEEADRRRPPAAPRRRGAGPRCRRTRRRARTRVAASTSSRRG